MASPNGGAEMSRSLSIPANARSNDGTRSTPGRKEPTAISTAVRSPHRDRLLDAVERIAGRLRAGADDTEDRRRLRTFTAVVPTEQVLIEDSWLASGLGGVRRIA